MFRRLSLAGLFLAAIALGAPACKGDAGEKVALRARILSPEGVTDPYAGLDTVRISILQGTTSLATQDFAIADPWTLPSIDADLASPLTIRVDGLAGGAVVRTGRTAPFLPREARADGQAIYFAAPNAWAPAAAVPAVPRLRAAVARLADGRVVMAGGTTTTAGGMSTVAGVEVYDPEAGEWSTVSTLATARSRAAAVQLVDGTVLVAGGIGTDGLPLASVEIVTIPPADAGVPPAGVMAVAGAPLPQAWSGMSAARLSSGKVLLAGGTAAPASTFGVTPVVFDPATGAWSVLAGGVYARDAAVAALADGRVAIIGGADATTAKRVDVVTEETGSPVIVSGPSVLKIRRYGATAIAIGPARIFVVGGADDVDLARPSASAEILDLGGAGTGGVVSTFAPERAESHRSFRGATIARDGVVVLDGGFNPAIPRVGVEGWDPATSQFRAAPSLPELTGGRGFGVPLGDGTVLLAGGEAGTSTQIYNPPVDPVAASERVDFTIAIATATRATGSVLDGATSLRLRLYDSNSLLGERTFPLASSSLVLDDLLVTDNAVGFLVEAVDDSGTAVAWGATVQPIDPDGIRGGALTILLGRTGEFNLTPSLLPAKHGDGGGALLGDRVVIVGGLGGESATDLYDPTSGATSALTTSTLPTSRRGVVAVKTNADRLYVVGGISAGSPTAAASLLTRGADGVLTWSTALPVPTPITRHSAVVRTNGSVVVQGSQIADTTTATPTNFTGRWTGVAWATPAPASTPTLTRARHQSILLGNGTILLAGGVTTSSGTMGPTIMATECETLEPVTLAPTLTTGCLTTPRRDFVAISTTNGGAVLCGGVPALAGVSIATCERYNPTTRTFSPAGSLSAARDDSAAARLSTGEWVIVGGQGPLGLAAATAADVWNGSIAPFASMQVGRSFPTPVALPDGRLVVLGGTNTVPTPDVGLDSVEVWTPPLWKSPYPALP